MKTLSPILAFILSFTDIAAAQIWVPDPDDVTYCYDTGAPFHGRSKVKSIIADVCAAPTNVGDRDNTGWFQVTYPPEKTRHNCFELDTDDGGLSIFYIKVKNKSASTRTLNSTDECIGRFTYIVDNCWRGGYTDTPNDWWWYIDPSHVHECP
ncbi:hypothetical protein F5Y16DRAFT_331313 [Xylariaceae sp. FL0255]|nr:hypothetical protein F5Y16DRAFT_331313 [Xylariaceae sp. FL0255]